MITNNNGLSLSMAAWLASNDYDYQPDAISATSLMKPLRQIVLAERVPEIHKRALDVTELTKSRTGTSVHDSIEGIWNNPEKLAKAFKTLPETQHLMEEYDNDISAFVDINPETKTDKPIVVYMEQRKYKTVQGFTVSGKYDFVFNGQLEDHKTTSAYSYTSGSKAADYILQGSIYRWLAPDIITKDTIAINFVFTDWSAKTASKNPAYPQQAALTEYYSLLPLEQVENWIEKRIQDIRKLDKLEQEDIPECTAEELWMNPSSYKYYADPNKTDRATKDFKQDMAGAYEHLAIKGKGIVLEIKSPAKACSYCPASTICKQYVSLVDQGLIETL